MKRSIFFAIASAAVFAMAVATPASAHDLRAKSISYADLDLGKAADAQTMLTRINETARDVCRFRGMNALDQISTERSCRRTTVAQTVAHLNSPMVTSLYNGRFPYVQTASLN